MKKTKADKLVDKTIKDSKESDRRNKFYVVCLIFILIFVAIVLIRYIFPKDNYVEQRIENGDYLVTLIHVDGKEYHFIIDEISSINDTMVCYRKREAEYALKLCIEKIEKRETRKKEIINAMKNCK